MTTKKSKKTVILYILLILMAFTSLSSVVLCIFLTNERQNNKKENSASADSVVSRTYSEEEVNELTDDAYSRGAADKETELLDYIMADASAPNPGYINLLKALYPEYFVYYTGSGFKFHLINDSLPLSQINNENLVVCNDGQIKYSENGVNTSEIGIDVSEYQGEIAWDEVADYGVSFAIMRAGYRGYVSGALVEDATVRDNIISASENGIEIGLYFFSQAVNEEEVLEEAQILIDMANEYEINGPLVIDVEKIDSNSARANYLTQGERTLLVTAFCNAIRNAGYTPMIYGNTNSLFEMLDYETIANEKIWFANFSKTLYFPYQLSVWQYSESMTIPGITGNVDIDIRFSL